MLKIIGIVVIVLIVGVLVLAAMRPDTFSFERKGVIKAPPDKVFGFINDFKNWSHWSPWEKKDPNMKRTYGASTVGKGATYGWEGDKNVGVGNLVIFESTPSSKIALNLNFEKPFKVSNVVSFLLTPVGDTTEVVWRMEGASNFMSKVMQLFMSMDKMVGRDFDAGLASLKAAAEKP